MSDCAVVEPAPIEGAEGVIIVLVWSSCGVVVDDADICLGLFFKLRDRFKEGGGHTLTDIECFGILAATAFLSSGQSLFH